MSLCQISVENSKVILGLNHVLRLVDLQQLKECVVEMPLAQEVVCIDGSNLEQIDSASAMVVVRSIIEAGYSREQIRLVNCRDEHEQLFALTVEAIETPSKLRKVGKLSFLAQLGKDTFELYRLAVDTLNFTGVVMFELCRGVVSPEKIRSKELSVQLENVGLKAIPIVALVTFLIGIVIAYLTGVQMQKYGANIFIVDAVAIAMCRELSPILAAIIIAGRSGSAFTAQIGTMKINEEIDAMQTMGLSIMRVLIIPRLLALVIALPLLVFVGDVSGIIGGMVIADFQLNITGATFIERLNSQLIPRTILVGLVKAPVFAFFIAAIACRLGMQTENNARSLGMNTTKTVVRSIVAVILLNAAFSILFNELGI